MPEHSSPQGNPEKTGIFDISTDGILLNFNNDFAEILSYPPEQLTGCSLVTLIHPSDRNEYYASFVQLVDGALERIDAPVRFRCGDGSSGRCRLLMSRSCHQDGRADHLFGIIHPWKKLPRPEHPLPFNHAEATTSATYRDVQKRELGAFLNTIPAAIYVKDMTMRYRNVNDFFCRQFNVAMDTIAGKSDKDILPPELATACEASDREAIETGVVISTEDRVPNEDRWWSTTKTIFYGPNHEPRGLVGVSIDITEQKRTQLDQVSRLTRQRDQLIREVHHRIKNHLQGVVGLLREHMSGEKGVDKPLAEAISLILSIANVYGLQSRASQAHVELHELLQAITRNFSSVTYHCPSSPVQLIINSEEAVPLALVLNELLTNAVKHTRPEGKAAPRVELSIESGDNRANITISNRPARLPAGFDFTTGAGFGTGLELLRSLMPPAGVSLDFHESGEEVTVELCLEPPLLEC